MTSNDDLEKSFFILDFRVLGHFSLIFGRKIDLKPPIGHFFPKRIHQNKFELKIPILRKNDGGAT